MPYPDEQPLSDERPILMNLTINEARVLQAAVYNGQLSGKLRTFSGLRPSMTAELAADLYGRIKWLLDERLPPTNDPENQP